MTPQEFKRNLAIKLREKNKPKPSREYCVKCLRTLTTNEAFYSDKCPSCLLTEKTANNKNK